MTEGALRGVPKPEGQGQSRGPLLVAADWRRALQVYEWPLTWESSVSLGSPGASVAHTPGGSCVSHESWLPSGPFKVSRTWRTHLSGWGLQPSLTGAAGLPKTRSPRAAPLPFSPGRPNTPGRPWGPGSPPHPLVPGFPGAPGFPTSPLPPGRAAGPGGPGGPR